MPSPAWHANEFDDPRLRQAEPIPELAHKSPFGSNPHGFWGRGLGGWHQLNDFLYNAQESLEFGELAFEIGHVAEQGSYGVTRSAHCALGYRFG